MRNSKEDHSPQIDAFVDQCTDAVFNTVQVTRTTRVQQSIVVGPLLGGGATLTLILVDGLVELELDEDRVEWLARRLQRILDQE